MKIKFFLSLFLIAQTCFSFAQTISFEGAVLDSGSKEPVPFATLGIKGKGIGTVANEHGIFHLVVESGTADANEQVIVSSVGYQSYAILLAKLKEGKQTILLVPADINLKTVNVKPEKYKTKVFGRTGSNTMMMANMYTEGNHIDDVLGKEQACIISIDQHCFLRDFNMYVTFNRFESVKFRLNFYSVKDGTPDELIVDKDILFDVTEQKGWVKVDLTKYNIYLDGHSKVAVGIQWVKSVKRDSTSKSFSVSIVPSPLRAAFFRDKSQDTWKKKSPAYVAFNITADSFKPGKKDEKEG